MHVDKYFCDHCGKPLVEKEIGILLSMTDCGFEADICTECQGELKKMVLDFVKKEEE